MSIGPTSGPNFLRGGSELQRGLEESLRGHDELLAAEQPVWQTRKSLRARPLSALKLQKIKCPILLKCL